MIESPVVPDVIVPPEIVHVWVIPLRGATEAVFRDHLGEGRNLAASLVP